MSAVWAILNEKELMAFLMGFGSGVTFFIKTLTEDGFCTLPDGQPSKIFFDPKKSHNIRNNLTQIVLLAIHEKYPNLDLKDKRLEGYVNELEKENLNEMILNSYESWKRGGGLAAL